MTRDNAFLSDKQVKALEAKLNFEKEKIQEKLEKADSGNFCLDKNELSDPLDEASVNIETQKMLRFRNREMFYLKKIKKSLDRVSTKVYGLCDECDGEISFERLIARPTAELCIGCKEEAELIENNNFYQKKSKSLGKSLQDMR